MSPDPRESEIRAAVATVVDPCSIATGAPVNLMEMGMLHRVELDGDTVVVTLSVTSPVCWQAMNIVDAVQRAVLRVEGIEHATCRIDPTIEWMPDLMDPVATARLRRLRPLESRSRPIPVPDLDRT